MKYLATCIQYLEQDLVKKRKRTPPNQQPYFHLIAEDPEIPDFMKTPSDAPEENSDSDSDSNHSDSGSDISFFQSDNNSESESEPTDSAADSLDLHLEEE